MKELTILVDLDDTLETLLEPWVAELNRIFGRNVDFNSIDNWEIDSFFPGVPSDFLYYPLQTKEFWELVKPKFQAPYILQSLIEDGHEVYIVTASYYKNLRDKLDGALFRIFPFISYDRVIITQDKSMVRGDVLIDDGPHNHDSYRKLGLLMDAPHNKNAELLPNMVRVHNWNEVYVEIEKLSFEMEE